MFYSRPSAQARIKEKDLTPEERFKRIETNLELLQDFMSQSFERSERRQEKTQAQLDELGRIVLEMARISKDQGERLNILIGIVERYFSNGEKS